MNKYSKLKTINVFLTIIAIISVIFNIYLIATRTKLLKQDDTIKQTDNNNETVAEEKVDNKQQEDNKVEEVRADKEKESKVEYVYIEGEEKEIIVEKEIEVPATSTDATITYVDAIGNTKTIELPSGTTINFSAGEHGTYDSIPSSITLTDNQELDITDASYKPSKVEVNYIFKGLSYSGDTLTCVYSLADNTVNVDHKQITNTVIKNGVAYIKHEYLESTGTQYIDTGINFNASDYNGEIVFQYTSADNNTWFFGAVNNSYVGCEAGISSDGSFYASAGFTYSQNNTSLETTGTFTTSSFSPTNNNFYLFARNAPTLANVKAKVFSCKIKKGTQLKLDLVPAERISDGKVGALDLVNGTLLERKGSGEFKCPNDTVLIPGINAGKVMASGSYESGSTLTLTAIPNDDYIFAKWFDGNTSPTRTITVGSSTVYTALFIEK